MTVQQSEKPLSMVEKVARAISVADQNITAKTYPEMSMERMAEYLRAVVENGHYNAMARAAIEAMREPTDWMKEAGAAPVRNYSQGQFLFSQTAGHTYRHMIDAALSEESTP